MPKKNLHLLLCIILTISLVYYIYKISYLLHYSAISSDPDQWLINDQTYFGLGQARPRSNASNLARLDACLNDVFYDKLAGKRSVWTFLVGDLKSNDNGYAKSAIKLLKSIRLHSRALFEPFVMELSTKPLDSLVRYLSLFSFGRN